MRIQTFSVVAGTRACDARCPFCVSKMTGFDEIPTTRGINQRNFRKAARLAERAGTTTVLFTGKGEPTLYPDEISAYLRLLADHAFPLIELQTNALAIGRLARDGRSGTHLVPEHLDQWYELGLDTVAISVVGVHPAANQRVYHRDYPDLARTLDHLHQRGFSLRLCVMMQNGAARASADDAGEAEGFVARPEQLAEVIDFCRANGVEQLTVRPIRRPQAPRSSGEAEWVEQHGMSDEQIAVIDRWVADRGTHLLSLLHGAQVYDVGGQNVCVADCLTVAPDSDNIRTLIFYSDGRVTYDWQYDGAVLLGGRR